MNKYSLIEKLTALTAVTMIILGSLIVLGGFDANSGIIVLAGTFLISTCIIALAIVSRNPRD